MPWLLQRRLRGFNEVVEVDPAATREPGVSKFKAFLEEYGLATHEGALELGQALKVSWEEIAKLGDTDGYMDGDSRENLLDYIKSGRVFPGLLHFLQRQQGNCGQLNKKNL